MEQSRPDDGLCDTAQVLQSGDYSLRFVDSCTGSYHGQTNNILTAFVSDVEVGTIEYTVYLGQPSISMVSVPQYRRNGYASAMVRHLQSLYPDIEISWGVLTDEGKALYDSIAKEVRVDTALVEKFEELRQVCAKLDELQAKSDLFWALPSPSAQQREEFTRLYEGWNDLHDREFELSESLRSLKPTRTIIVTEGAFIRDRELGDAKVVSQALAARAQIPPPTTPSATRSTLT